MMVPSSAAWLMQAWESYGMLNQIHNQAQVKWRHTAFAWTPQTLIQWFGCGGFKRQCHCLRQPLQKSVFTKLSVKVTLDSALSPW